MDPRITATTFYQYLTCPLQLWFEYHGKGIHRGKLSPIQEELMRRGVEAERRVARRAGMGAVEVLHEDEDEAFADTLRLMKEKKTIYQGTLIDQNWIGRPDFLIPKRGRSRLGSHHYTVADVKLAAEMSDEHRFQLTFYALLLDKIQGVRPRYAYHLNAQGKETRFDVNEFAERFHLTLSLIEKILAGEKPAPFLSGSCKDSPWFEACKAEALACDDLSLVYRIWRSEYDKLRVAGIRTVKDLADADIFKLKDKVPGISLGRLERLKKQAIAYWEDVHVIMEPPDLPTVNTEVYYDVETDVLREPPLHYLHGLLLVTRREARGARREKALYKHFLVRNPKQEGRAWLRFCKFVDELPDDAVIYHYGRYERQVISELTERYGIPRSVIGRFSEMRDLCRLAQRSVIFPTLFFSLKDIARYLGFRWRHSEASGINSVKWYQEWRRSKGKNQRQKKLRDILEYNEDDVRATKVLKDFLAGLRAGF